MLFLFFSNGHIRNVVSTLPKVVKIDVEDDNVVSTLSNVVQFNVEKYNVASALFYVLNFNVDIHNVASTLIWRCATSRRHINLKTTLNWRWNVCWGFTHVYIERSLLFDDINSTHPFFMVYSLFISLHLLHLFITTSSLWLIRGNLKGACILGKPL